MIVAITGRRNLKGQDKWVRNELERVADKLDPSVMISGMALGADTMWAQIATQKGISLSAHCPFPQQAQGWTDEQTLLRKKLLAGATEVTYAGDVFDKRMYFVRNATMMAAADTIVAVWEKEHKGGTWNAVKKARSLGKPIVHINFSLKQVTMENP